LLHVLKKLTWIAAGSGKTALVYVFDCRKLLKEQKLITWLHHRSIVINEILRVQSQQEAATTRLAYFYCVRSESEPERSKAESIMRCLLRQLAVTDSKTKISPAMLKIYSERKESGFEEVPMTIPACIDLISSTAKDRERTCIVIDALDECGSEDRQSILDALDNIVIRSGNPTKIFLSSREIKDIVFRLRQTPNVHIRATDNSEDINYYVRTEVDRAIRQGLLCAEVTPELRMDIVQCLCDKAQGMYVLLDTQNAKSLKLKLNLTRFQWVKTSVQSLRNSNVVVEEDFREQLGRLPPDLHDTYKPIYAQLLRLAPKSRALAIRVLRWLLCATRRLSTSELIAAVSVGPNGKHMKIAIQDVINACHTLVVVDTELNCFRLAHMSVKEFLEQHQDFREAVQNTVVAERCVVACLKEETVLREVHEANELLYRYAMLYWGRHCSLSENGRTQADIDVGPQGNQLHRLFKRFMVLEGTGSAEFRRTVTDAYRLVEAMEFGEKEYWKLARHSEQGARLRSCVWAEGQETPNFAACVWGFREILEDVRRTQPADLRMENIYGKTCLQIAISNGHDALVQLLVDRHADVNQGSGELPIHLAAATGNLNTLNILIRAGANIEARNWAGQNALMVAIKSLQPQVVERLIELHADVDVMDHTCDTPLHLAVKANIYSADLFGHGTPINVPDQACHTPLHLAILFGRTQILRRLLKLPDIDVNYFSEDRLTPLELAIQTKDADSISELLVHPKIEAGLLKTGRTPLLLAACQHSEDLLRLILQHYPMNLNDFAIQYHVDCSGKYHHGPIAQFWSDNNFLSPGAVSEHSFTGREYTATANFLAAAVLGSRKPLKDVLEALASRKDCRSGVGFRKALLSGTLLGSNGASRESFASDPIENALHRLLQHSSVGNPNQRDQLDRTPLWWAISTDNIPLATRLIAWRAVDVNIPDSVWGLPPLSVAILGGRESIAKLLIERPDININLQSNEWGQTPLIYASRLGCQTIVEHLLKKPDIALYLSDWRWRRTALSWAAGEDNAAIVKMLLPLSAGILNHTDNHGMTALSHACSVGAMDVIDILAKEKDIDVGIRDNEGQNALWFAMSQGLHLKSKFLLDYEDGIKIRNYQNQSLLAAAAINGHTSTVEMMTVDSDLAVKFGIETKDSDGRTPLGLAAGKGHVETVASLLKADSNFLRMRDFEGRDPLSLAAQNGHLPVVTLLLSTISASESTQLQNPSMRDSTGRSPLSWAAEYGHLNIVKALRSAYPYLIGLHDFQGRCVLSWAASGGHLSIVEFLLSCLEIRRILRDLEDFKRRSPSYWAKEFGHYLVAQAIEQAILEESLGASILHPRIRVFWQEHQLSARFKQTKTHYFIVDTGQTLISEAAQHGEAKAVKELLLRREIDPNKPDKSDHSPLWHAIQGDHKVVAWRFMGSKRLDDRGERLVREERPEWVLEDYILRRCFRTLHPCTAFPAFRVSQSRRFTTMNVQWSTKARQALRVHLIAKGWSATPTFDVETTQKKNRRYGAGARRWLNSRS
jgi:ankyrin repeat protein